MYTKIVITFPFAVDVDNKYFQYLDRVVGAICEDWEKKNPTQVMWPAGHGSQPTFSQADCAFMGRPVDPSAPKSGEPTFNDEVYEISVSSRERYEGEK